MEPDETCAPAIPGLSDLVPIQGRDGWFRARQIDEGRAVAVRLLDCDPGDRLEYVVLGLEALSQHPHVVTVHGYGTTADAQPYLLLELLEEGSLAEWVAADGRLPCAEVLDVAVKIAGALETAHRAGVVHGALSPEHILVAPNGEPHLSGLDQAVLQLVHDPEAPPVSRSTAKDASGCSARAASAAPR